MATSVEGGTGRVGESVLQRMGRAVTPAAASTVTFCGIALLGLMFAGTEALGLSALRLDALNAVSIVLLVACGQGLWLLVDRRPDPRKMAIAYALAVLVSAVAVLRLMVYFGWISMSDLQAVFPELRHDVLPLFERITLDAAGCFLLLAAGMLAVDVFPSSRLSVSQGLAVLLGLLALFSFVSDAYGNLTTIAFGPYAFMDLLTSSAFLALGVGLLYARPNRGFARIILSDTAGGESARWLLPVAIALPVLVGAARLEGERIGLFNAGAGVVILVMSLILLQLAMIWWNSALLYRADVQRESIRRHLHHQSRHDALTGLANRPHFVQRLREEAERARKHRVPCALLYLDLDGFKQVNDTMGHPAGDELLQAVAERLRGGIRGQRDLCARLGGDEFVVILEDSRGARAYEVAERLLVAVSEPYRIDDKVVRVGVSIGIAFGDGNTESADALLKAADVALYAAKHGGKGRIHPPQVAATKAATTATSAA